MMKKEFVFLILHYCSIDDTINCVQSIIKNCKMGDYQIVIVDNGSPNDTGMQLKKKYINNLNITILLNNQNLGFSKGNNIGFKYAKEKYHPSYIIMINNDIKIIQDNFCNKIKEIYECERFDVLGPKIILPNGSTNFYKQKLNTVQEQKKIIMYIRIRLIANYLYLTQLIEVLRKFKNRKSSQIDSAKKNKNVILHGSCLIFSKNYIEKFDGLDSRTFLYCEEELLYIRLMKNKMISIYEPKLCVFHNEDASTRYINKNLRNRNIFINKNLIKSNKILLEEIKKMR